MEYYFANIIIITIALLMASYFDIKRKEIPNFITYPLIIIGFVYSLFPWTFPNLILAIIFFGVGYYLNSKGLLGGGDVKLITGIILLTPPILFTFQFFMNFGLLSCLCALMYFGIMIISGKESRISAVIKFAPCIAVGYFVTVIGFLL